MSQKIFVYGALRKDMHFYDQYLRDENCFCSYGYIKGSLKKLRRKSYPALILEGESFILGEIYDVQDKTLHAIRKMVKHFKAGSYDEFDEKICNIYNKEGQLIDHLPVFVYNTHEDMLQYLLEEDIGNDYVTYIHHQSLDQHSFE